MIPLSHKMHPSQDVPPNLSCCVSPAWRAVPSAEGMFLMVGKMFSCLSPSLCTFSLSTDKPNSSELWVSTGDVFVLLQGNKSEINQASAPFIAQGNLQTLNSICGLALYILEGIFTNC